ncbi:HDIG domain-containing protein [Candidatus Pacearchaeota archaeon]|nr:HDIG domain-containing protein [Candidatus Pacearchaeota archaeon]
MSLPISRQQALEFLKKYNQTERDFVHFLESEAVMKELAGKFGEDVEYWGMLGLLHDIDWGVTKNNPQEHLTQAPKLLKEMGFDENFIQIIVSHGYGFDCAGLQDKKRTSKIEFALACAETINGLIHSYALMRGKKISDMQVKGLKKKFKDKAFAAAVDRNIIRECENLDLGLDEFFDISIKGIKKIKDEIGLE